MSGIAGGADVILIPEHPLTVEEACEDIRAPSREREGLLDRRRVEGYELTYARASSGR